MRRTAICVAVAGAFCAPAVFATHTAATSLGAGAGGSISTESAVPLELGKWSFGVRYEQQESDRLSDATLLALGEADPEADLHSIDSVTTTVLSIAYGLNENLTLGLTLPFIERRDIHASHFHAATNEIEIEHEGDAQGHGDAKLYGLWRFSGSADHSTALLFGTSVATGVDDDTSPDGEVYEQEFQSGSGSTDPFVGIAHSRSFGRLAVDGSVTYNFVGTGSQDSDLGGLATYNASVSFLLNPDSELRWRLVLEANGMWRDQLSEGGERERNSGGNWINLAPGVIVSHERWSVFGSLAVPVVNEPNGDQDKQDFRFQLGFQIGL